VVVHPSALSEDYLVVGEGGGDAAFIRNLCEVRKIGGIQIEDVRGNANFEDFLGGLRDRTGFERVKGILIVSDNDDKPDDNFKRIRSLLKNTKFPYEEAPLKFARHNKNSFAISVMMLPFTLAGGATRGCLETVLLQAMEPANPELAKCVDEYRACIPGGRTKNEEDKFRMRSFIAALHREDPNLSLSFATSVKKGLVNLNHTCFDEIADILKKLPELSKP